MLSVIAFTVGLSWCRAAFFSGSSGGLDEALGDGVLQDLGGASRHLVGLGVAEVPAERGGHLGAVGAARAEGARRLYDDR